jgi:hypothetical protein
LEAHVAEDLAVADRRAAPVTQPGNNIQGNDQREDDEQRLQREGQIEIAACNGDAGGDGSNFDIAQQDQPGGVAP